MNEVGSISYQKNVLDRLERQKKISGAEKIAILSGIFIGMITSIIGIQMDFVALKQGGLFVNLAKKVHKNQEGLLGINVAGKVGGNQMQLLGIQYAERISGIQSQGGGLQYVEETFGQVQGIGGEYAKNVSSSRIEGLSFHNKLKK